MALLVFLMFGLISIILFHFDWYFPIWVSVALMALVVVNGDEAYEAKINPETCVNWQRQDITWVFLLLFGTDKNLMILVER